MKEPTVPEETDDGLQEWETPELIIEDVRNATQGGGTAAPNNPGEGGTDPEFYSS